MAKCPKCGLLISRDRDLKRHLVVCKLSAKPKSSSSTVECPKCGQTISRKNDLKRHMLSKLCKPGPYNCPICQADLPNAPSLRSHKLLKLCKGPAKPKSSSSTVECPKCGQTISRKNDLKRHMLSKLCKPGPYNCPICQADLPNAPSLRSHELKCRKCLKCGEIYQKGNHHCSSYKCPECSKDFQVEKSMKRHWRKHHPESAPARAPHRINPGTVFRCCNQTFKNGRQLHTHKLISHYRRGDEGTGLDVPSTSATFSCTWPKCNAWFKSNRELTDHYETYHNQGNPSTSTQQSDSDSEEESEDEDSADEIVGPREALGVSDADRLYKRVGAKMFDKAGLAQFRATRERTTFRLTKHGLKFCEQGLGLEVLSIILDELLFKYRRKKGKMQIKILSKSLDPPIVTPLFATTLYNPWMLLNYVESVLGSKDRFLLDDDMTIDVIHISPERTGGAWKLLAGTATEYIRRKTGTFDPRNALGDYRCLALCLAASLLINRQKAQNKNFKKSEFYNQPQQNVELNKLADDLCREAGVDPEKSCGGAELAKFQNLFTTGSKYSPSQLIVLDYDNNLTKIYSGIHHKTKTYLLLLKNHYFLIWNFNDFLGVRYRYCEECSTVYDSKKQHVCEDRCPNCQRFGCDVLQPEGHDMVLECDRCFIVFQNLRCYLAHLINRVCIYERYKCDVCLRIRKHEAEHVCKMYISKCRHCYEEVDLSEHLCTVQEPGERTRLGSKKFNVVHFDVETGTDQTNELKPYLVCCSVNCQLCIDMKQTSPEEKVVCEKCGERFRSWYGWDSADQFCHWLTTNRQFVDETTILTAHNSAKFDGYFLYQYAVSTGNSPKLSFRANELLSLEWGKIRLKDSYQFLKCALDKFPDMLGFEGASKGFFAYKLADVYKDLNYSGPLPRPEMFGIDSMDEKKRDKFWKWYDAWPEGKLYDMKIQAIIYCNMDVFLLQTGWQIFRETCLKLTRGTMDPLIGRYFTLASFAAATFRTLHMHTDIGIIPWGGYRNPKRQMQSQMASIYLEYLNDGRIAQGKQPLKCVNNCHREVKVGPYKVDGMDRETGEVTEILGCMYHAHQFCNVDMEHVVHPLKKPLKYGDVYQETLIRISQIERLGHPVRQIWECEIRKEISTTPLLSAYFQDKDLLRRYNQPLDPSLAVFGGRVEMFKPRMILTDEQIRSGWSIEDIDFVSLYPWVQWFFEFPALTHPDILYGRHRLDRLVETFPDYIKNRFGLVYCRVVPPKRLRYPVLPYRARHKTTFCLCKTCAEEDASDACDHGSEERRFIGVYTMHELQVAIERGYEVDYLFEIWDYGTGGAKLFESYVTEMVGLKAKSSKVPDGMSAEEYCRLWNERVPGLNMKREEIFDSPAMRMCAKLLLNSLWGKFCENADRSFTCIVKSWSDLRWKMNDKKITVTRIEHISSRCLVMSYKQKDVFLEETSMYNPVLGAYVTAYARTALLTRCMEIIGDRLCYIDTDSAIYLRHASLPEPLRGETLGQLSDELGGDELCTAFQCFAPKSYRMEVSRRADDYSLPVTWYPKRTVIRTKGVFLNSFGGELRRAVDDRRLWNDLIDMKLVEGPDDRPVPSIEAFYAKLGSRAEIPQKLIGPCLEAFRDQDFTPSDYSRSSAEAPGLILPQPTLGRDRFTAKLMNLAERRKKIRFRYDKGVLLNNLSGWPENRNSTVPYGYSLL